MDFEYLILEPNKGLWIFNRSEKSSLSVGGVQTGRLEFDTTTTGDLISGIIKSSLISTE